jgi:RNA 3'-terminal phosphate cyclase (ATP)
MLRPGLYPRGGGELVVEIQPANELKAISLLDRGPLRRRILRIVVTHLPRHIAERESAVVRSALDLRLDEIAIEEWTDALSPGNVAMLELQYENITELVTAFGQRGLPAEKVAAKLLAEAQKYLTFDWPVGEHLADQLMLPLALAPGDQFRTGPLTLHAQTNLAVIRMFLGDRLEVAPDSRSGAIVRVRPGLPDSPR